VVETVELLGRAMVLLDIQGKGGEALLLEVCARREPDAPPPGAGDPTRRRPVRVAPEG
jgi:hypothetical protein